MAERGWAGTMGQLLHYLRIVGADQDDEGRFVIQGDVVSFLGMGGENADVVVPAGTVYFRSGRPCGLAAGLGSTSYGTRPVVIC